MMSAKKSAAALKRGGADTGKIVVNTAKFGAAASTVTFGAVRVSAPAPKVAEIKRNVVIGQAALARAVPKLIKPGVVVKKLGSVPMFRADPQDPSRLIREFNGQAEVGRFVNGKFKVLSAKR
ncbi:hypothetical protein [Roseateles sp. MS654]|uniref:hypothetical protein n=1 Tax=Roseateles sp. MS654 TaxID=3412685 RepID=UPI003C2C99D5